ncbi:MAG: DUF2497 domain-containing protein [Hoeflea sp.]|uniref:PopZ family protein n=1 Tax=Hoeflea sp. TaxID=1940281 RepID=UPI00272F10F3|nr:DUF2497 domain-containing protein [Hoeflea sp.]MDP2120134.1 DUF2497 domain-containing protein [Hoeflea sp.]
MGQAGAQREPSMEEILASIRRIIENNEPALDGSHGEARDAAANPFDDDDAYADEHDLVEDRQEVQPEAPVEQPLSRPISLAEVAALARAAPKPQDIVIEEPLPEDLESVELDEAAARELRDALVSNEPVESPARIETAPAREEQPEHSVQVAVDERPEENHPGAGHPQSAGQLVSLQTGEKVAAAFGELDAAIAAGQSRSFDEIAEEMLRPMLTQWLDDNLPTLVERLVREEIERVSRGNRR